MVQTAQRTCCQALYDRRPGRPSRRFQRRSSRFGYLPDNIVRQRCSAAARVPSSFQTSRPHLTARAASSSWAVGKPNRAITPPPRYCATEPSSHRAIELRDDLRAACVVGPHHVAEVFRVQLRGELSRPNEQNRTVSWRRSAVTFSGECIVCPGGVSLTLASSPAGVIFLGSALIAFSTARRGPIGSPSSFKSPSVRSATGQK